MAIQFNLNALSRFSNVNFGDNDAIANLDGGNGLVQNEKLGFILTRKFRSSTAEKQNNAVRTELLKALGNAFGLNDGVSVNNGKTTFTDQFMNRLEEILGPAFKRGDFGIKNGVVDSGKPLTQRRIQAVYDAATTYAARDKLDKKFEDVSTLLNGGGIDAIIGDARDEGWSSKLNNFAELAAKIHHAALTLMDEGDSTTIVQEGVTIELTLSGGGIRANLTIGGETRAVEDFAATNDQLCMRMMDAINGLYDSFTEKKDGDLTYGRAALANKVLAYYKELAGDDLDNKADCPLRNFASGLLVTKARVTEGQIARLTNRQLAEFVTTLCQAGDASGITDLVTSTIMDADEEDRKIEEENALWRNQDDDFEYDLAGDEQVDENKVDAKPQSGQPANGVVDINSLDD